MTTFDVIIIGSGINSLVCAAELTRKGRKVLVLERETVAGGCIRTEEATLAGFRHDLFSMSYPLFVTTPFYPKLKPLLEAEGVTMVNAAIPTGVLLPDGRALVLRQDRAANQATFAALAVGDGDAHLNAMQSIEAEAPLLFGLLGNEPRSAATIKLINPDVDNLQRGADGLMRTKDGSTADADPTVTLASGTLEASNVDPSISLVRMIELSRSFEMQMQGVKNADENAQAATRLLQAG